MRFSDFIDPERGPATLVRLAIYALVLVVACQALSVMIRQIRAADFFFALLGIALVSPLAYFIREARRGHPLRHGTPRGAERTPLLPRNEEDR